MEPLLSAKLENLLAHIEIQIERYIENHAFFLEFRKKDYAACYEGQTLLKLNEYAINIRYEIEYLRKCNL